jgi:hypothetical protein
MVELDHAHVVKTRLPNAHGQASGAAEKFKGSHDETSQPKRSRFKSLFMNRPPEKHPQTPESALGLDRRAIH